MLGTCVMHSCFVDPTYLLPRDVIANEVMFMLANTLKGATCVLCMTEV